MSRMERNLTGTLLTFRALTKEFDLIEKSRCQLPRLTRLENRLRAKEAIIRSNSRTNLTLTASSTFLTLPITLTIKVCRIARKMSWKSKKVNKEGRTLIGGEIHRGWLRSLRIWPRETLTNSGLVAPSNLRIRPARSPGASRMRRMTLRYWRSSLRGIARVWTFQSQTRWSSTSSTPALTLPGNSNLPCSTQKIMPLDHRL